MEHSPTCFDFLSLFLSFFFFFLSSAMSPSNIRVICSTASLHNASPR